MKRKSRSGWQLQRRFVALVLITSIILLRAPSATAWGNAMAEENPPKGPGLPNLNQVAGEAAAGAAAEGSAVFGAIVLGVLVVAVGTAVWYFVFHRKRKRAGGEDISSKPQTVALEIAERRESPGCRSEAGHVTVACW